MDLNKIGRFIFNLRKEKGLSQNGLADLIPVTRQAVSTWELGKSLPDSQTLVILSEIFNVSIDELLAGKRFTEEKISEETKSEITLNLVDEYNSKLKTVKRITITFTMIILIILLIFLGYYFINSYNSIKVYKVKGENTNFKTYNGIIISTKQKIYIRLGELIKINKDTNIENVKLYFKDTNNKERTLYEDSKTDILIESKYGYNEGFTNSDLKYIVNNLYLEIKYAEKTNRIKLTVKKDFSNNIFFYDKTKKLVADDNSKSIEPLIYDKIKLSMEQIGTKEDKGYKLKVVNENEKINIELMNNLLLIDINSNNYKETWSCYFNNDFSFSYSKVIDNIETNNKMVIIKTDKKLSSEDKKLYDKLTNYINKYIISSN